MRRPGVEWLESLTLNHLLLTAAGLRFHSVAYSCDEVIQLACLNITGSI